MLPPQWGDGGHQVIVAGYHRGTSGRRGLGRMVMPRRHLTGFRVQGVHSPAVIRRSPSSASIMPRLWATRQQAEDIAAACAFQRAPGSLLTAPAASRRLAGMTPVRGAQMGA